MLLTFLTFKNLFPVILRNIAATFLIDVNISIELHFDGNNGHIIASNNGIFS